MFTTIEDMVTTTNKAPSPDGSPPSGLSVRTNPMLHSGLRALHPASSAIYFLTLCHHLKICADSAYSGYHIPLSRRPQKRKGWINQGIKGSESIADHMYRMALMSLIAGDVPGSNRERCIKIQIVHDTAEAIVGDITPSDGVPKAVKSRMEQAALDEMCLVLGGGIKYLEMILQALEYEMENGNVLDELFTSIAGKFQTELGKCWAAEIIARRNSRLGKIGRHPAARSLLTIFLSSRMKGKQGSCILQHPYRISSCSCGIKAYIRGGPGESKGTVISKYMKLL
ncbi:unnamed protein product [Malus baccata var. baccata]